MTNDTEQPWNEEWVQVEDRWIEARIGSDSVTVCRFGVDAASGEARARLASAAPNMARALMPVAEFIRAFDARPMRGLDDEIYSIHGGRGNGGASLFLSELRAALAALEKAGVPPQAPPAQD